jgi:membrane associated rhomboid family serine protease
MGHCLALFAAMADMVFPLYDDNPFERARLPYVTWGIIAVNLVVFLFTLGMTDAQQTALLEYFALIPGLYTFAVTHWIWQPQTTLVTSIFLHGGWEHVLGNMVYLFVFGDDIEEKLGPLRFLIFCLLAGIAGGLAFVALDPRAMVPLVGASGAIAGVLAAYLMLRPCAEISVFVLRVVVRLRAFWVIGGWALLQLFSLAAQADDGVAYIAHIGGLAAGAGLFLVMRPPGVGLFECLEPGAGAPKGSSHQE